MELIKFPELCSQYYKVITFFVETNSHKITHIAHTNPELLKRMLGTVQLGLTSFTPDIQSLCFDYIQAFAKTVYYERDPTALIYTSLAPFLKITLDMIFTQQVDSENKTECYNALFGLICCYHDQYKEMMQLFVQAQTPIEAERLAKEFGDLSTNLEFKNTRLNKTRFVDKFDKFVTNISFICKM
jgi:hypothetical protein